MNAQLQSKRLRQVAGIAVLPLIFILPIVLVLLMRISAVHDTEATEEHSDTVISEAHEIREDLYAMESAMRGYLLTADSRFRQSFTLKAQRVDAALATLKDDAADNPAIAEAVMRLQPHVRLWVAYATGAMSRRPSQAGETPLSLGDQRQMDTIANDVGAIVTAKLSERGETIARAAAGIRAVIFIVIVCALLAAVATGFAVRRVLTAADVERRAERERVRLEEARRRTAELERENVRIRSADRFKSEYLATMSHELRTPLTAMLGFSELIRDGKVGAITVEQGECLDHVIKGGHHLIELVGTVLDLAKVEAGKLDVAMVPADPRLPTRDVVDGMRELAARKSIRLDLEMSRAPREALVDPPRLRQILYNYLSNAIKFTPAAGAIIVRLLPEGADGFRLEVSDNGIGIAEEDVGELFKAFRQVEGQSSTEPGTGLGLALTKRLAEAQGGYVGVISARGKGSTFHAVFPDAVAAARAERRALEGANA